MKCRRPTDVSSDCRYVLTITNDLITDPTLAHLDGDEFVAELMSRVQDLLEVETVSLLLVDSSRRYLIAQAARGLEEEVRQGFRVPIGAGFSGRVAQLGHPIAVEAIDSTTVYSPLLLRRGIHSLLGVPLTSAGHTVGVLTVGSTTRRAYTEIETNLLQLAGDRIAAELAAAESRNASWALRVLQRSLMPNRLPTVSGLEFAERFVPGGVELVGGDWYDAFELPSGRIGVAIGDVVGSGLHAAVVMGRLRSVLRSYAFVGDDPGSTLDQVDAKFSHFEPSEMATIGFAVVEPDLSRVVVATAGHPPPLIVGPTGPAEFVPVPPGPPIGARLGVERKTISIDLPPGTTYMTYTDGLFERRREPIDESLERLRGAMHAGPVEGAVSHMMEFMIGADGLEDDTAVLALRRLPE
jgi:serine phosphatase RsbU (regulator of sigma subunit)